MLLCKKYATIIAIHIFWIKTFHITLVSLLCRLMRTWIHVPWMSTQVTPILLPNIILEHQNGVTAPLPSGSTVLEICRASDVARSVLAGVTARMRQVSFVMNWNNMSLICCSISAGWSPTGTLVSPGKSISVMFSTVGMWKQSLTYLYLPLVWCMYWIHYGKQCKQ